MAIAENTEDELLQYDVNRSAAKISALSSGKIDEYEYVTDEETMSNNLSERRLDPEIINKWQKKQMTEEEYFTKDTRPRMILNYLKQ